MVDVPIALVLHFQIFTIKEGTLIIYLSLIEMKGILLDSKISGIEFDPCDQPPHATSSSTTYLVLIGNPETGICAASGTLSHLWGAPVLQSTHPVQFSLLI